MHGCDKKEFSHFSFFMFQAKRGGALFSPAELFFYVPGGANSDLEGRRLPRTAKSWPTDGGLTNPCRGRQEFEKCHPNSKKKRGDPEAPGWPEPKKIFFSVTS